MKITGITTQQKNPDRVNVFVDDEYRFSLDIVQITELGIKIGLEVDEQQLESFSLESEFGKLYAKALAYALMRPHSEKEMRDYLWRKTQMKKPPLPTSLSERVHNRLIEKGYVDDSKFARWWVENRKQRKGVSRAALGAELFSKGVAGSIIETALQMSERTDGEELLKLIKRKSKRYSDEAKLIVYLQRQGFRYDEIRAALDGHDQAEDLNGTD